MDKKYQIFISSTFIDLIEQREQVLKTILKMGHLPVGMEMFDAADQTQWEVIKRHIDNSDYYIVIIAHRYGSVDKDGVGFTEKEYDYAKSRGIPCLAFVIDDSVNWPPKFIETGAAKKSLQRFKQKAKGTLVNHWDTSDKLAYQVLSSLTSTITISPGRGWIRADEGAASPQVLEEMSRLSRENNELKLLVSSKNSDFNTVEKSQEILSSKNYTFSFNNIEYSGSYLKLFSFLSTPLQSPIIRNLIYFHIFSKLTNQPTSLLNRVIQGQENNNQFDLFVDELLLLLLIDHSTTSTGKNGVMLSEKGRQLLLRNAYSNSSLGK